MYLRLLAFFVIAMTVWLYPERLEAETNQAVLARQILGKDIAERDRAVQSATHLSPSDIKPELRAALIKALEREGADLAHRTAAAQRGEHVEPVADPEFILRIVPIVVKLRRPEAIPALAGSLGMHRLASEALTDFGEQAVPALLTIVTHPENRASGHVVDAWTTLRFIVENSKTAPLSTQALLDMRNAVKQTLTTGKDRVGDGRLVRYAIDLAIALNDSSLRQLVEVLANDSNAVKARGVQDQKWIEKTQRHAAERLAGIPSPVRRLDRPLTR